MKVGATIKKSTWLFLVSCLQAGNAASTYAQFNFWKMDLLANCKMAAHILIMCAHWDFHLPPLSKNKQWLIGG